MLSDRELGRTILRYPSLFPFPFLQAFHYEQRPPRGEGRLLAAWPSAQRRQLACGSKGSSIRKQRIGFEAVGVWEKASQAPSRSVRRELRYAHKRGLGSVKIRFWASGGQRGGQQAIAPILWSDSRGCGVCARWLSETAHSKFFRGVARPERLELPTLWFEARCSIQLSYGRVRTIVTDITPFPCGEEPIRKRLRGSMQTGLFFSRRVAWKRLAPECRCG